MITTKKKISIYSSSQAFRSQLTANHTNSNSSPNFLSNQTGPRKKKGTFEREIAKGGGGDALDELPQLLGDSEGLQIVVERRSLRRGWRGDGGGEELEVFGSLEGFGAELVGTLGGLGDYVGELGSAGGGELL